MAWSLSKNSNKKATLQFSSKYKSSFSWRNHLLQKNWERSACNLSSLRQLVIQVDVCIYNYKHDYILTRTQLFVTKRVVRLFAFTSGSTFQLNVPDPCNMFGWSLGMKRLGPCTVNARTHSLCELLPTDKYNASDSFRPSQHFHHYSVKVKFAQHHVNKI